MKVRVNSKSAVEHATPQGKAMTLMVYFDFLDEEGRTYQKPTGSLVSKEDFDKYEVGETYEIK